ncbi:MAG: SagB/ThcOx family dehydrogenase, partial [Chloroflexi bacterium]|nr:SagB/ThcOx family dehydrogenase [Chloroflexota bacterium]
MSSCALPPTPAPAPSVTPFTNFPEEDAVALELPEPTLRGEVSLEETLQSRRSIREYSEAPLTLEEVSQLLWAAQGQTTDWGGRTSPSAGALYPLETYLIVGSVRGLEQGVYKYRSAKHDLLRVGDGDRRALLAAAALDQAWIQEGAAGIILAAVYERTTGKYAERGIEYVHMEAGHAAENLLLQATALGLGSVPVTGFYRGQAREVLGLPQDVEPLYIVPVGRKPE